MKLNVRRQRQNEMMMELVRYLDRKKLTVSV
jgi:hypothetical protein